MNLKLLYGMIYGILGLIAGCLLFLVAMVIFLFFWDFIFAKGIWPIWTRTLIYVLTFIFGLGVIYGVTICIQKGLSFGERLEKKDKQNFARKFAWPTLIIVLYLLGVFMSTLMTKAVTIKADVDRERDKQPKIEDIFVANNEVIRLIAHDEDQRLLVKTSVYKDSFEPHELSFLIAEDDNRKNVITDISESVQLDFPQQSYNYNLSYERLANDFYEAYVDSETIKSEEVQFDRAVEMIARLSIFPQTKAAALLVPLGKSLLVSEVSVNATFKLSCSADQCRILEIDKKSE